MRGKRPHLLQGSGSGKGAAACLEEGFHTLPEPVPGDLSLAGIVPAVVDGAEAGKRGERTLGCLGKIPAEVGQLLRGQMAAVPASGKVGKDQQ